MDTAQLLLDYLISIPKEGLVFGFLFWVVTWITLESSSLWGALRSAMWAEVLGNLPYLAGEPALSPLTLLSTALSAVLFVRLIVRVGELSTARAAYATATTYFMLTAVVACS